jgi:hypothetical protein
MTTAVVPAVSPARVLPGVDSVRTEPAVAPAADSMQVLPFGAQLWVEVGAGGSVDPPEVKRYFGAGYTGAITTRWEPRSHLAVLVHAGFQSLPRTEIVVISGGAQAVSFRLGGNATTYSVMAGPAARLWRRLWLETGAGFSHFAVGPGEESIGPLTEPPTMTRVRNTHGVAARAGLAWRFPITDVRSMSVAVGWETMHAGASGEWLQQASARLGYRFY